ncbi:MAG: ion channel [Planctomycetota bacterium]
MPPTTRRPGRFAALLAACFALFGSPAVVHAMREGRGEGDGTIGQLVLVGALITLLIASANAASTSRRTHLVAGAFAAPTICLQVAGPILRTQFRPAAVDLATLCESLCSYLLLGLIWSVADSFVALDCSYLPLTTLGYGDIVPTTQTTRTLAFTEAMVGQLLLVVLVARLVGLKVAQLASRPASAPAASGPEICP